MEEDKPVEEVKKEKEEAKEEESTIKILEAMVLESLNKTSIELGITLAELTMNESNIIQIKRTSASQHKHGDYYCTIGPRIIGLQKKHKVNKIKLSQVELSKLIVKNMTLPSLVSKVEVADNALVNFTLNTTKHTSEKKDKKKPESSIKTSATSEPAHKLTVTIILFCYINYYF